MTEITDIKSYGSVDKFLLDVLPVNLPFTDHEDELFGTMIEDLARPETERALRFFNGDAAFSYEAGCQACVAS